MYGYFERIGKSGSEISSDVEARVVLVSGLRHLLQMVNYSLVEWVAARNPSPDAQPPRDVLSSLMSPSDGSLVTSLESLLVCAEQNGWSGAFRPLLREIRDDDGCRNLCGDNPRTLAGLLRGLIELRNDGGEGHGLPGGYRREEELACYEFVLESLKDVIPALVGDEVEIGPEGREVRVRLLRSYAGNPVLVRKIKPVNSASVRVQGKYYNEKGVLESVSYEAWNPFSKFSGSLLPSFTVFDNSWGPQCHLPDRVTDTFIGREEERASIVDWFDDEESRACLVFGDGGVGKTTLVVEVIHQILEEDVKTSWRPKVISFYTAKRVQFGVEGLSPVGAGKPHLMDLLVHLHVLLLGMYPGLEFFKKGVVGGASFLQEAMRTELSLAKADHLIVIDNAETLIENDVDRDELGRELKEIARRIGRVLITSRRREILGADPVEVKALPKLEAVKFLRARADKLKVDAVKSAKDMELLVVVEDLECRPIVLEAFISALCDPACATLGKAKARVLGMLQKDLGAFLFSDAWGRFSKDVRRLLILMTRVGDVHDAQSFRICADIVGVAIHDAEKALAESSGIASIVHVDGGIQISFSRNFLDYCQDKEGVEIEQVSLARNRYSQFLTRVKSFTGDRVLEAFRTPLAKAAHRAKVDGDNEAAHELYQQAVLVDATNGLLFDRYAYFLFHELRRNDAALHQARRATELLPSNGECWYTRGLIEARMGDARAAEASLGRAESFGVDPVRCAIQRAWAFLKSKPRPQLGLAQREMLYLDSQTATHSMGSRDRIELRNITERFKYLSARERF